MPVIDAVLHALLIDLIRRDVIDADAMHADLTAIGEHEAATFVGVCAVQSIDAPPVPKPRTRLRVVHPTWPPQLVPTDGGNST